MSRPREGPQIRRGDRGRGRRLGGATAGGAADPTAGRRHHPTAAASAKTRLAGRAPSRRGRGARRGRAGGADGSCYERRSEPVQKPRAASAVVFGGAGRRRHRGTCRPRVSPERHRAGTGPRCLRRRRRRRRGLRLSVSYARAISLRLQGPNHSAAAVQSAAFAQPATTPSVPSPMVAKPLRSGKWHQRCQTTPIRAMSSSGSSAFPLQWFPFPLQCPQRCRSGLPAAGQPPPPPSAPSLSPQRRRSG